MLQAFSGWRRYRNLSADWRNLVMYAESGQDWHYFEPLIAVLNDDLAQKITYLTSDVADPGLRHEHELFKAICIPAGFFLTLHFNFQQADVLVLTMMDLGNLQLKKSIYPVHYIYIFHSLGSTHMVDSANAYDAYDSLFCVGPHHVAELHKRESIANLPTRNLVEYGHPRLENLLAEARAYRAQGSGDKTPQAVPPTALVPSTVLIAPTWGEDSIFNRCGEELTGMLLDAGYQVIVRPHYQTLLLMPECINKLRAKYGRHANFEYQDQMGESETLLRSDILICDWSAMAIEYALGLEKPVVFIDLPRRVRNPHWQKLKLEPMEVSIRELAGVVVAPQNLQEIPEKIEQLLQQGQEFRQRMQKLRTEMVFNLGHASDSGAREIARLAAARARLRRAGEQRGAG